MQRFCRRSFFAMEDFRAIGFVAAVAPLCAAAMPGAQGHDREPAVIADIIPAERAFVGATSIALTRCAAADIVTPVPRPVRGPRQTGNVLRTAGPLVAGLP